jgi:1,4-alpha-glucan branching enzyme
VVYNHATGSCALAKMYWEGDATASNNPWFNVKAKHPYNVYHDINHESDFVRAFVKRNLKYLLEEFNIDGFRFDLTKGFTQNNTLGNETAWSRLDESRVAILKDYADAVWAYDKDAVVIFEHLSDNTEEKRLAEHGIKLWRKMSEPYGQTAMGYSSKSSFSNLYAGSNMPFGSLVGYMESHDEERLSYKQTKWGISEVKDNLSVRMKRLALNAAFFFTVPGPKMIWQFGELGYDYSINYPSGKESDRTGKKPVKWDYLDNPDRKMLYDTYASLITFRKDNPSFFDSDAAFEWKVGATDWSMRYIHCTDRDGRAFVVVGNFSTEDAQIVCPMPAECTWKTLDGQTVYENTATVTFMLPAAEYRLLVNY